MVQQLNQQTLMCYSKPTKQTNVEIQTVTHFTLYQVHFTEDWSLEDINFGYNFEPSVTRLSLVYIWIITQVKGGLFVLCMLQIYQSLMVNGTINEACKLEKKFLCKHVMTETRSYNDLMHEKMANEQAMDSHLNILHILHIIGKNIVSRVLQAQLLICQDRCLMKEYGSV